MLELLHYPGVAADVLPGRGLLGGARHRLHLRPRHQAQVRGLQGGLSVDIYLRYLHIYTIQVVCHEACQTKLLERLGCKKTFVEGARNYRDHPGAAVQSICRVQSG